MLAPAYFSPNYKYFDQLLQTVKKTTVLILVFKEFSQHSIRPLISVFYAKGYHDFPLKNFCPTVPKKFVEEPFCVSENFWYPKMLGMGEGVGITIFCQKCFVSQYRKLRRGTLLCFTKILVYKKFMNKGGGRRRKGVSQFSVENFWSHSTKKFHWNTSVYQKVSGSEKFYASKKGEGVSRFSVEFFLPHSAENFRRGNPFVFL